MKFEKGLGLGGSDEEHHDETGEDEDSLNYIVYSTNTHIS